MFEAIDGRRTIADIAERPRGDDDAARRFFEKLWQYDQVTFDASKVYD